MTEPAAPPIRVVLIPVTPLQQNCSLVWVPGSMRGAFVDPGGEPERLLAEAGKQGVTIEKILLTHGHLDHAGGAAAIQRALGVPIIGPHPGDDWLLESIPTQAALYGLHGLEACVPDQWLADGDEVAIAGERLSVHHCPGHTPGHVVFVHHGARIAFVGDVLFQGSIGRTDFPRGDHGALIASIREKLFPLGDDIRFVPGHGPVSSFGAERARNPFVADRLFGQEIR